MANFMVPHRGESCYIFSMRMCSLMPTGITTPYYGFPSSGNGSSIKAGRAASRYRIEVHDEFKDARKNDKRTELAKWAMGKALKKALLLEEDADPAIVSKVVYDGYAPDLTDDEIEKLGRDPFLIAYALVAPRDRCVVTMEVSKPKRQRANRHMPDVCGAFGIPCCNTFQMLRSLDFKTGWNV